MILQTLLKFIKKSVLLEIEPIVSESFNVFLELPLKKLIEDINIKLYQ